MWKFFKHFIVPEDEMDILLRDRDRYYAYKVMAEIRQEDKQRETDSKDDQ